MRCHTPRKPLPLDTLSEENACQQREARMNDIDKSDKQIRQFSLDMSDSPLGGVIGNCGLAASHIDKGLSDTCLQND
jgi:hypothetical protein